MCGFVFGGLVGIHKQGGARQFKRLPQGGVGYDAPPRRLLSMIYIVRDD